MRARMLAGNIQTAHFQISARIRLCDEHRVCATPKPPTPSRSAVRSLNARRACARVCLCTFVCVFVCVHDWLRLAAGGPFTQLSIVCRAIRMYRTPPDNRTGNGVVRTVYTPHIGLTLAHLRGRIWWKPLATGARVFSALDGFLQGC